MYLPKRRKNLFDARRWMNYFKFQESNYLKIFLFELEIFDLAPRKQEKTSNECKVQMWQKYIFLSCETL